MRTKLFIRAFVAAVFGALFGQWIHHDYVKWNLLGKAAYLEFGSHRFDKMMAHPKSGGSVLISYAITAVIVAGLYELIVVGLGRIAKIRS